MGCRFICIDDNHRIHCCTGLLLTDLRCRFFQIFCQRLCVDKRHCLRVDLVTALRIDPAALPYACLDLGGEWVAMTGLPMVFAVWSARKELIQDRFTEAFRASLAYGMAHMDDIVREQSPIRGIAPELTRAYLTRHIVFELGEKDYEGMRRYLQLALALENSNKVHA